MLKLGRVAIFNQVARKGLGEKAAFEQLAQILKTDPHEDPEKNLHGSRQTTFAQERYFFRKAPFFGAKMLDIDNRKFYHFTQF